jgi:hypothetical protein
MRFASLKINRLFQARTKWHLTFLFIILACFLSDIHSEIHKPQQSLVAPYLQQIPRGGWVIPAGWNPFGYKITKQGEDFLKFGGTLDSDVGRVLASLKNRKRWSTLKSDWLEILRVSKSTQTMRIYRMLKEILDFCLKTGLVE